MLPPSALKCNYRKKIDHRNEMPQKKTNKKIVELDSVNFSRHVGMVNIFLKLFAKKQDFNSLQNCALECN